MSVSAAARNRHLSAAPARSQPRELGVGYYQPRSTAYAYAAVATRPAPAARAPIPLPFRRIMFIAGAALVVLVLNNLLAGALFAHSAGGRWSGYRPAQGASPLAAMASVVSPLAPPVIAAVEAATAPPPAPAPVVDPARPVVAPPAANHTVIAPPSVDPATIERVLQQYSSPAVGQGNLFYDLGVKYGIDPAYALAFYIHESAAGTKGVARFTKSIGNIRTTAGYRDYQGYRAYDTWEASIEDWYKLIKDLYVDGWGKRTVAQIIPTYAPVGDNNDPSSYIASVTNLVDSWQQK